MKKIMLICFFGLLFSAVFCQSVVNPFLNYETDKPRSYLGISTGINNMVGLLGAQVDVGITKKLSFGGGLGLSSWGFKYALNIRYCPKGFYGFYSKTGYSQNSGLKDFESEFEVSSGVNETVRMDLNPVGNFFFTAGWAWKMGKRNRIYIEGGYAIPLKTEDYYTLYDNVELSESSKQVLQILRPGGFVFAVGLNFAISSNF
nr:hypothetical protein [Bacteroidota bacterium]